MNCNAIFTQEAWKMLNDGINLVKMIVPIVLIVLISLDVVSAVAGSKEENMSKSVLINARNRIIAAVLVFLIPTILQLILNLPPVKTNLNLVDDPLCGVTNNSQKKSN
jgi:hypothetical protein